MPLFPHYSLDAKEQHADRSGFSLLELLIVLGMISLLVAIVVPAWNGAQRFAHRGRESAAARALLVGWASYSTDQAGAILPGYKAGLEAWYEPSQPIPPDAFGGGPTIAARWPWRLAPYIDFNMQAMYVGAQAERLSALDNGDQSERLYFASLYPSFGMNTTFVGGDSERSGFLPDTLPNGQPNPLGRFYASRLSQILRPSDLLVFASARTQATPDNTMWDGYFRLEAPRFMDAQWATAYDPELSVSCGNIATRVRDDAITAQADGSVRAEAIESLRDMRRWSPFADAWEWDLTP